MLIKDVNANFGRLTVEVKTLADVKADMSELYEQVKGGTTDLKVAAELANITGKFLKASQLELANDVFLANKSFVRRVE